MKKKILLTPIALVASMMMCGVYAQSGDTQLPAVVVKSDKDLGYLSSNASSATRIDVPIKETPASVSVVDESLIADKAIRKPSELADVVSGVQQIPGYGNSPSQWFIIRGFNNNSVNYRDGYRSSDKYTPRDFANVERVEFVKGPSSVIYGNSEPAGAVNTITKTPFFSDYNYVGYSIGSWSTHRVTGDFNKAYDQLAIRLNVAADNANSFVDFEKSKNLLLAPSFKLKVSKDTEVLYAYEYYKSRMDGFSNGLPMDTRTFSLRSGATSSQPWADLNNESNTHRIEFKTALNDQWQFRQGLYSSANKRDYRGVSTPGSWDVHYNSGPIDDQKNNSSQTELIGNLALGESKHKMLIGFEKVMSEFKYAWYDGTLGCWYGAPSACASFDTGLPNPLTPLTWSGSPYISKAETNAFYFSDHITYGKWRWLVGLRSDDTTTSSESETKSRRATTGRLGAMYFVLPSTAVYYSWGQSFVPNLGTTTAGATLAPEKGVQHEVGVKHTIQPGLEATLAAFEITKQNVKMADGSFSKTNGEQQSKGYEASLVGRVTNQLKLIANYSHIDKATVTRGDSNVGKPFYGVAEDMWNVWGVYNFKTELPGALSMGLGVVNVGDRFADSANSITLPGYTRYDAGLYYKINKVNYALNLKNIGNAKIYDSVEGYFIQRQAPRSMMLTAGMQF